jgi:hypothetical protein
MLTSTIAGMYRCRVQKADSEVAVCVGGGGGGEGK